MMVALPIRCSTGKWPPFDGRTENDERPSEGIGADAGLKPNLGANEKGRRSDAATRCVVVPFPGR
jgi:hypothetical protein